MSPSAELAPVGDGTGDRAVTDHGDRLLRAPLDAIRVSVLWKADVSASPAEREARMRDPLSMDDVARTFDDDLGSRGSRTRVDLARIDDPGLKEELAAVYPEATPVGALQSVFDAA